MMVILIIFIEPESDHRIYYNIDNDDGHSQSYDKTVVRPSAVTEDVNQLRGIFFEF